MNRKWIAFVAGLTLLAGATLAVATATEAERSKAGPSAAAARDNPRAAKPAAAARKKLVNLNAASPEELKGLPGGSDVEAARIIAGRPYNSKAFLVTNKVISDGRYGAIRTLVVAGKPAKAVTAKK